MSLDELNTAEKAYPNLMSPDIHPNPMQADVWQQMQNTALGVGLLVKGPTGSGKTETIVLPALAQKKRVIMVYPTRSLVDDQIGRMEKILRNYSRIQ